MTLRVMNVLLVISVCLGACGPAEDTGICDRAARYATACVGSRWTGGAGSCDPQTAERILATSCEDLRSLVASTKADEGGMDFWDWASWVVEGMFKDPSGSCLVEPDGDFQIMVLSDTHLRGPDMQNARRLEGLAGRFEAGEFPRVELVIITGDIVDTIHPDCDHETGDPADNRLVTAASILNQFPVPVVPVMGNHEYKLGPGCKASELTEMMAARRVWREYTGRDTYYAFMYRGFKFIALDNTAGRHLGRRFEETQLDWLERQLAEDLPVILLMHRPPVTDHPLYWCDSDNVDPDEEARFYSILESRSDRIQAVFVGHGHLWVRDTLFGSIPVYETAGFGKGFTSSDKNYHVVGLRAEGTRVEVAKGSCLPYIESPAW